MNIYWREEKEEKEKKEKKTKMYSHCGLANQPTRATNQTAAEMVVASQPHQAISRDLGPLIYNGVVLQYIFYYLFASG